MSLIVYNGSPRGQKSNSSVITSWFLEGYKDDTTEIRFLKKFKQHKAYAEEIKDFDKVLFVFPLYVDGMPGQVKHFYETLYPFKDILKGKPITFIIHSGFSDGIQSRTLEQHCNRFAKIMNMNNHGVIIIPGSEGFRLMPPSMTKKKHLAVSRFGASYKDNEPYDETDLKFLVEKKKPSILKRILFRIMRILGMTNMYWNRQLKKNDVYDIRFDAPYKDNPIPITSKAYLSNKQ